MNLTPREKDKLMVAVAAMVARGRLSRGVKLNYPESIALITDYVMEGARDGRLVWADAFRLTGDIAELVHRPSLLAGHTAIATILYAAANAPANLDRVRAILANLGCKAGATIVNGLMICRFAAKAAAELRRAVTDFLRAFREGLEGFTPTLPRVWIC